MKYIIAIIAGALLSGLSGCANIGDWYDESYSYARSTRLTDHYQLSRMNVWTLPLDSRIYVATEPMNTKSVLKMKISESAYLAFNSVFGFVTRAEKPASYDDSLRQAKKAGFEYILYPKLIHSQDTVSTWEEAQAKQRKPLGLDQAVIQLILAQTNGYVVDIVNISGQSGLLTFYADQPLDLIKAPISDYALALAAR